MALSLEGAIAATPGTRFYLTIDGDAPSDLSPWYDCITSTRGFPHKKYRVTPGQAIVIAREQTIRARTYLPGYFLSDEITLQFPYKASGGVCVLCIVLPVIAVLVLAAVAVIVLRLWFWSQTVSAASRFAAWISAYEAATPFAYLFTCAQRNQRYLGLHRRRGVAR